jgi:guanosine-3',5'-bis(diphosphate) 3'-pyrophosphohydrolase
LAEQRVQDASAGVDAAERSTSPVPAPMRAPRSSRRKLRPSATPASKADGTAAAPSNVATAEPVAEAEPATATADATDAPTASRSGTAQTVAGVDSTTTEQDDAEKVTAPGRVRARTRLARLAVQRGSSTSPVLEALFRTIRSNHPKADLRDLERAFEMADLHHRGQQRRSGDPYITHPLAVATILAELGMTPPTLMAALLHDTIEDTDYTLDKLRVDFGDEIANLVDGVTKLDKVKYGDAAQAETVSRSMHRWRIASA